MSEKNSGNQSPATNRITYDIELSNDRVSNNANARDRITGEISFSHDKEHALRLPNLATAHPYHHNQLQYSGYGECHLGSSTTNSSDNSETKRGKYQLYSDDISGVIGGGHHGTGLFTPFVNHADDTQNISRHRSFQQKQNLTNRSSNKKTPNQPTPPTTSAHNTRQHPRSRHVTTQYQTRTPHHTRNNERDEVDRVIASLNLKTGDDAVSYFALHGNDGAVQLLHLNRAPEGKQFRPYDLVVVPRTQLNPEHFTLSAAGVVWINPGHESDFVSLPDWTQQATMYNVLTSMSFFKYFLVRKMFKTWKSSIRFNLYMAKRKQLASRLFFTKSSFREPLLNLRGHLADMWKVQLLDHSVSSLFELEKYLEHQGHIRARGVKQLESIQEAVQVCAENVCSDVTLRAQHTEEEYQTTLEMGITHQEMKNKSMVLVKQERIAKLKAKKAAERELEMLPTFLRLTDYMMVEGLAESLIYTHQEFINDMDNNNRKSGIFETVLHFTTDAMEFQPSEGMVIGSLHEISAEIISALDSMPRILFVEPFKSIVFNAFSTASAVHTRDSLGVKTLVEQSTTFQQICKCLDEKVHEDFIDAKQFSNTFETLRPIYEYKEHFDFEAYRKSNHTINSIKHDLETLVSWTKDLEKMKVGTTVGILHVDSRRMRNFLTPTTEKRLEKVKVLLAELASGRCKNLLEEYASILRELDNQPQGLREFAKHVKYVKRVAIDTNSVIKNTAIVEEMYRLCSHYGIRIQSEDMVRYDDLKQFSEQFTLKRLEAEGFVENRLPEMTQTLDLAIAKLGDQVVQVRQSLSSGIFIELLTTPQLALSELSTVKAKLDQLDSLSHTYSVYQELFNIAEFEFRTLHQVKRLFEDQTVLWETRQLWQEQQKFWMTCNCDELEATKVNKLVQDTSITMQRLQSNGNIPRTDVLNDVLVQISEFRKVLPLIMDLGHPSIKARHWVSIFVLIGKEWKPRFRLTFSEMLEAGLAKYQEQISELAAQARGEMQIEAGLAQIAHRWEQTEFKLSTHHGTSGTYVLQSLEDIFEQLEDHQVTVATMLGSRHVGGVIQEVRIWEHNLSLLSKLLNEWVNCQRSWMYMDTIFAADTLQQHLPEGYELFCNTDRSWREILRATHEQPSVLRKIKEAQDLIEQFKANNAALEKIQKLVSDYLQVKRMNFPRFYFLSDDELLEMMSLAHNPQALQMYLPKCFDAIDSLVWSEENSVSADGSTTSRSISRATTAISPNSRSNSRATGTGSPVTTRSTSRTSKVDPHEPPTISSRRTVCTDESSLSGSSFGRGSPELQYLDSNAASRGPSPFLERSHDDETLASLEIMELAGGAPIDFQSLFLEDSDSDDERKGSTSFLRNSHGGRRAANVVAVAMQSSDGEYLPLCHPVTFSSNLEGWLRETNDVMVLTLKESLMQAIEAYGVDPRDQIERSAWVESYCAQSIIAVDQIAWTRNVEYALQKMSNTLNKSSLGTLSQKQNASSLLSNRNNSTNSLVKKTHENNFNGTNQFDDAPPETALQLHYQRSLLQIQSMIEMIRENPTKQLKTLLGALLVLDVHARDVSISLIDQGIDSPNSFEWERQLRYYYNEDSGQSRANNNNQPELHIRQTCATLPYTYEYLGNSPRLVATPLTDRCYMTLTNALHLGYGGAPSGPAGTGKTETTKDLAKALARQCVVFNCSDSLDIKVMGSFFSGLAQCGAWACFDEFNRIDVEVLSVIAQQVHTIQQAIRAEQSTIMFEGTQMPLQQTVGVFITMNPGYAGRTQLPDNLKALFRPVAMMVPDYKLIAEIILFSEGFSHAHRLAKKMAMVYRLSSEQLSKQSHYDFGMRAVKPVLVAAGKLKRMRPNFDEDVILLQAMKDSNIPKFLSFDIPLFQNLLQDLFPGIETPCHKDEVLRNAICEELQENDLVPVPEFVEKILQLHSTQTVRHGLMLVGETSSGKSVAVATLAEALSTLFATQTTGTDKELDDDNRNQTTSESNDEWIRPVERFELNPKSLDTSSLYGTFNLLSGEWRDGIIPNLMRSCVSHKQDGVRRWIILDGPVDAVWIENMNTVLDDNKTLCLANSERIRVPNSVHMLFEVEDLLVASPATVSRCGMVYFEQNQIGTQAIVESWVKQQLPTLDLPTHYATMLQSLVNQFLPVGLKLVKELQTTQATPSTPLCVVNDFLNLLSSLLHPKQWENIRRRRSSTGSSISRSDSRRRSSNASSKQRVKPVVGNQTADDTISSNRGAPIDGKVERNDKQSINATTTQYSKVISSQDDGVLHCAIEMVFIFAFTWGFGNRLLTEKAQQRFSQLATKELEELLKGKGNVENLFDVVISKTEQTFVPWTQRMQAFSYSPTESFDKVHVSTPETTKYQYLLSVLLGNGQSTLCLGESGAGKATIIDQFFKCSASTTFHGWAVKPARMNFTACTRINSVIETLEASMECRQRTMLGPAAGNRLVLHVHDLNMPTPEEYGSQPTSELLRQIISQGGFYDSTELYFRLVTDCSIVATCVPPPCGGPRCIPSRLQRHLFPICVRPIGKKSMLSIFQSVVGEAVALKHPNVQTLVAPLAQATTDIYMQFKRHMLPTPTKSTYRFDIRDYCRIIQSLLNVANGANIVELWLHEISRVLRDGMVERRDQQWFDKVVQASLDQRPLLGGELKKEEREKVVRMNQGVLNSSNGQNSQRSLNGQSKRGSLNDDQSKRGSLDDDQSKRGSLDDDQSKRGSLNDDQSKQNGLKDQDTSMVAAEQQGYTTSASPRSDIPHITTIQEELRYTHTYILHSHRSESNTTQQYIRVTDSDEMVSRFEYWLIQYNLKFVDNPLHLVLFKDALDHLLRLCRILNMERGHALLLGVGGSGRKSLTRLACFICHSESMQLNFSKQFGRQEFRMELKEAIMKLDDTIRTSNKSDHGSFSSKNALDSTQSITLLFTESQLTDDGVMEDLHNIMSLGTIPGLYEPEDLELIVSKGRAHHQQARRASLRHHSINVKSGKTTSSNSDDTILSKQEILNEFHDRMSSRIHLVFTFSAIGDRLRTQSRRFPTLLYATTIDWYDVWPNEGLKSVAEAKLLYRAHDLGVGETIARALCDLAVQVHTSVKAEAKRMATQQSRKCYATPTSYIELLNMYQTLLQQQRRRIEDRQGRYKTGLSKLVEAGELVVGLQVTLTDLVPTLEQASKETNTILERLATDQKEADAAKAVALVDQLKAKQVADEVCRIKEDCERDLREALPALADAVAALDSLDKRSIQEVKQFSNPPKMVAFTLEAVCILMGVRPEWSNAKKLMNDTKFLQNLKYFDKDNIDPRVIKRLTSYVEDPEFTPAKMKSVSIAACSLCMWVVAMFNYNKVLKNIEPKQGKLREAEIHLEQVKQELSMKQHQLEAVVQKVQSLENKYKASLERKQELEHRAKTTRLQLERAQQLILGLRDEKERWTEVCHQLESDSVNIPGNMFVACALVAYCGPFSQHYRETLTNEWVSYCVCLGIPVDSKFSLSRILSDGPEQERRWHENGLPGDQFSFDNGLITTLAHRWPLLIDPQSQARNWITQTFQSGNSKFQISRTTENNFARVLENAVRLGFTLLIVDIQEGVLDSLLNGVLMLKSPRTTAAHHHHSPATTVIASTTPTESGEVNQHKEHSNYASQQQHIKKGHSNHHHHRLTTNVMVGDKLVPCHENFRLFLATNLPNPHFMPGTYCQTTVVNFNVTPLGLEDQLLVDVIQLERPDLKLRQSQVQESISNDSALLEEIEDQILLLLASSDGNILDDEILIQELDRSKVTSQAIELRMMEAEATREDILSAMEEYRVVATRGSVLFFTLSELAHIGSMYQFSLQWFMETYCEQLKLGGEMVAMDADLEVRLRTLQGCLTRNVVEIASNCLLEKDRIILTFKLAVALQLRSGKVSVLEWNFFRFGSGSIKKSCSDDISLPPWLARNTWTDIVALENLESCFQGLSASILHNPETWEDWAKCCTEMEKENEHEADARSWVLKTLPIHRSGLTAFQHLLVVKVLAKEQLERCIDWYIQTEFGGTLRFSTNTGKEALRAGLKYSKPVTPLVVILAPGAQALDYIEELHQECVLTPSQLGVQTTDPLTSTVQRRQSSPTRRGSKGHTKVPQLYVVSLGQGQGGTAEKAILSAQREGNWVCLQNCHLAKSWLPRLECLIARQSNCLEESNISGDNGSSPEQSSRNLHPEFRLWLTCSPCSEFPVAVLQQSIKIACEPPKGMKGNVLAALRDTSTSGFQDSMRWRRAFFSVVMYNAVIHERKRFGSLGWNQPYDWMHSDLRASLAQLDFYLPQDEAKEVNLTALTTVVSTVGYGGRITDAQDLITNEAILSSFLSHQVVDDTIELNGNIEEQKNNEIGVLSTFGAPFQEGMPGLLRFASNLPATAAPLQLGLAQNAAIALQRDFVVHVERGLLAMGSGKDSQDGEQAESDLGDSTSIQEMEYVSALQTRVRYWEGRPWMNQTIWGMEKIEVSDPLAVLRTQELVRFQHLIRVIRETTSQLSSAILGLSVMSPQLEAMQHRICFQQVPTNWVSSGYITEKSLGSWTEDLFERLLFADHWYQYKIPSSFWISALFFPQGLFTSVIQRYARQHHIGLDTLGFRTIATNVQAPSCIHTPQMDCDTLATENQRLLNNDNLLETDASSDSNIKQSDQATKQLEREIANGVYFHGVYFVGARFQIDNVNGSKLAEPFRNETADAAPCILLFPQPEDKIRAQRAKSKKSGSAVECPLYKTSARAGQVSTTGHSTNFVAHIEVQCPEGTANYWIRRGVALICALDENLIG